MALARGLSHNAEHCGLALLLCRGRNNCRAAAHPSRCFETSFSPAKVRAMNHFRLPGDSPLTSMGTELNLQQLPEEDTDKGGSSCFHCI